MKVNDVLEYLCAKYPIENALSFDNVGLLVGDKEDTVKGSVVALDCDIDTVNFAVKNHCNLIVTHHPVIFNGIKSVLAGDVVYELIKNNISVISMHTNLDFSENGVNDVLCKTLGLQIDEFIALEDGCVLRKCSISPTAPQNLAVKIKAALGTAVRYTDSERLIENILICSGSGGDFLEVAIKNSCDALITADVKHNIFVESANKNISVFDAGHYATEDVIVNPLLSLLTKKFYGNKFLPYHSAKIKYC